MEALSNQEKFALDIVQAGNLKKACEWWEFEPSSCAPSWAKVCQDNCPVTNPKNQEIFRRRADAPPSIDLESLLKDKERIDWLADKTQTIGNVQLPTDCVMQNLDSLRHAIDCAMALHKAES